VYWNLRSTEALEQVNCKLSATVISANWRIGDQNYYRQFAELNQKNQNLLKKQFGDLKCS